MTVQQQTSDRAANGNAGSHTSGGQYVVPDRGHSDPDKVRVICVGAGFSGLCLAYKMKQGLRNYELVCYEKNASVGGTWYENRYPGCACDIPALVYSYSFAPNPSWKSYYASAPEIEKYILDFQDQHGLAEYIQLNSRVIGATWDETRAEYDVDIETPLGIKKDRCNVLISAVGVLNKWKWPAIPGLHDFGGPLLHSAHWDDTIDYKGKKVAVLGTGSSAIQIIPSIQPEVSHLTAFVRSSTWISPAVATDFLDTIGGGSADTAKPAPASGDVRTAYAKYKLTQEQVARFESDPDFYLACRKKIESQLNSATDVFTVGSSMNDAARVAMREEMERRIGAGQDDLKQRLVPTWPPGCRRLTPGDGYLEALVQPNVTPVFAEIEKVTRTGLTTSDGVHHEVDMIICATGFDVAFVPPFELKGRKGLRIQDEWADEPVCYLGLAAPSFPNYFSCLGPRGPWGNGPLLPAIESLCDYFLQMVAKIQAEQIRTIEVKLKPTVQFNEHADEWLKRSVWKAGCRSWYKMGTVDGKAWLWPGGTLSYLKTVKSPRYEDFDIQYKGENMWAYLGNGKTLVEMSPEGGDLAPYIRQSDEPWSI